MHLSVHWVLDDPSGVELSLYVCIYVFMYVCLYLCMVVHAPFFVINAASNCAQNMWSQVMGQNPLSGSRICLSIHLFICGPFVIFLFLLIPSVGVQHRNGFIPTLEPKGPQWGPVELICPSLCLFVFLSGRPRRFLEIIYAACNCAQRTRP